MQFGRWITYDGRRFDITKDARQNASTAETCGGLNSMVVRSSFVRQEPLPSLIGQDPASVGHFGKTDSLFYFS